MDPLSCIFPELHDMVFQHCNGKEFRELTLVSPSWNAVLEKSMSMMKKVQLALGWYENEYPDDEVISNITRRFRNMEIFCGNYSTCPDRIVKYIEAQAPTLLSLTIIKVKDLSEEKKNFFDEVDLWRLEELKLFSVTTELAKRLLSRCDSLIALELIFVWSVEMVKLKYGDSIMVIPGLQSFLERNRKLETLKLSQSYYDVFFEQDISDIAKFTLKYLKIMNIEYPSLKPEETERNFLKFLEKQSQSLERISISDCSPNVLKLIFDRMPALRSLRIDTKFTTEHLQLKVNERIIDLTIAFSLFARLEDLEKITRALPKVKKLSIDCLMKEAILEIIARNLPELQILRFAYNGWIKANDPIWTSLWPHAIPILSIHSPKSKYWWSVER